MPRIGLDDLDQSLSAADVRRLSPAALAYLGDVVYELFVRASCLMPPRRLQTYHRQVVNRVRAERQSVFLAQLQPSLTEAELDIVRRGRNAAARGPKRVDPAIYQDATALEALLGYLYVADRDRLQAVLTLLKPMLEDGTLDDEPAAESAPGPSALP